MPSALATMTDQFEAYVTREEQCISDTQPVWHKQYDRAAIGFVLSGWFDYYAQSGRAMAVPGTMLFGNSGEQFSVRHLDSLGNRRLVVCYDQTFLEDIAEACDVDQPRFPAVALPPGKKATALFAQLQTHRDNEDAACALAAFALAPKEEPDCPQMISPKDRRRILSVVGYLEDAFSLPCTVADLAGISGLGRYRFMRLFKAVTGQSVNQYVIAARLRTAVARITQTKAPISEIALDVGFNDLSHFNCCFRSTFNSTPRQMRKLAS